MTDEEFDSTSPMGTNFASAEQYYYYALSLRNKLKVINDIHKAYDDFMKNVKRGGVTHVYNNEDGWKEVK
jgi:hypothetical protein